MQKVYLNGRSGKMGQAIVSRAKILNLHIVDNIQDSDVVIDFSHPSSISDLLDQCIFHQKPLISGTTGFCETELLKLKLASKKIAILHASNFSSGISSLKNSILKFLDSSSEKFHCEIEEVHHREKVDFPSGTALQLKDFIESIDKKKKIKSLKIISRRVKNIFGAHKVIFKNSKNYSEFIHEALSRDVFADGALINIKKILNLKPDLYELSDF
tara:strand:+ start:1559 stop:2200 length:642 start_codon:yes stop_codon:yes gene_type:complete